ncbi:MAG TPA: BatA domain-containing protein [bacterium]|nr:BatA domain-containing protein [bacterium]
MFLSWQSSQYLLFLPAVLIPSIIHLLHRKKFKTVYFSNMRILSLASSNLAYKIKLYNIIQLIIRTLIIFFIILFFAQPLFSPRGDSNSAAGFNFNSYNFLIDNSISSLAMVPNSDKFFLDKIKDSLINLLNDTSKSGLADKIKIIASGTESNYNIVENKFGLNSYLNKLEISDMASQKKSVTGILSDFSKKTNDALIIAGPDFAYSDFKIFGDSPVKNIFYCSPSKYGENAGIKNIVSSKKIYSKSEPAVITAEFYSNFEHQNILKIYSVGSGSGSGLGSVLNDKKLAGEFNVNLKKGNSTDFFKINLNNSSHNFFCAEILKDNFEIDNAFFFHLDFSEPADAIFVENSKDTNVSEQLLLSSNYSLTQKKQFLSINDLNRKTANIIFLNNLGGLNPELITPLKNYVFNGGGLIIVPDESLSQNILNDYLGKQFSNEEPLLPVYSEGVTENVFFKNPGFDFLKKLEKLPIQKAFSAKPYLDGVCEIPLTFSDNSPAAVSKNFGKGKVIVFLYNHKLKNGSYPLTPEYFFVFNHIMNSLFKTGNIEYCEQNIFSKIDFKTIFEKEYHNIKSGVYYNEKENKYIIVNPRRPDIFLNSIPLDDIIKKFTTLKKTYPLENCIFKIIIILIFSDFILSCFMKKYVTDLPPKK